MRVFYQILETKNLSLLVESGKTNENLISVWDSIMREYQSLTKREDYSMNIRKTLSDVLKHNRLNGLISCYHLMRYGINCREQLKHWGVEAQNIQALEQKILQERTKLNIEVLQKYNAPQQREDFDRLFVLVENAFNRNLDENMSLKKWVYLCKSLEEKVSQLESIRNGRQNNRPGINRI